MDFDRALQAHSDWRLKFRLEIAQQGSMDASAISADDLCPLGKWLQGEGKTKYGTLKAHGKCVSAHAAFHQEAGKIAARINLKRFAEAEAMLDADTAYSSASVAVAVAILRLKKESGL